MINWLASKGACLQVPGPASCVCAGPYFASGLSTVGWHAASDPSTAFIRLLSLLNICIQSGARCIWPHPASHSVGPVMSYSSQPAAAGSGDHHWFTTGLITTGLTVRDRSWLC